VHPIAQRSYIIHLAAWLALRQATCQSGQVRVVRALGRSRPAAYPAIRTCSAWISSPSLTAT
jgi:transposase